MDRQKQGHRQPYTKVEITSIKTATAKAEKAETTEKPAAKATTTAKKSTTTKATTAKKTATKKEEKVEA